jgi:uncharacterized protein (TIGR00251 family)
VNLLEGIILTELLILFSAWVLWLAGKMVSRNSPSDAIRQFATTFWRTLAQRPAPLREVVPDADAAELLAGDEESAMGSLASSSSSDDDDDGRPAVEQSAAALRMATLNIKVVPHASRDQICGFLGTALKIQVMAPAEAGKANKAIIEVLSSALGVKGHQIQLLKGHFQAQKVIQIAGLTQAQLDEKLSTFQ